MKKLSKKQMITISITIVVIIALLITSIMFGAKGDKEKDDKEPDKKVESVEKENKNEIPKEYEKTDKDKTVTGDDVTNNDETEVKDTTPQKDTTDTKNNTANNTNNKVTVSKPSSGQSVTEPKPSHVHNWTEVKTQVVVPETGHYETIFEQKSVCDVCQTDITGFSWDERSAHFKKEPCKGGTYTTSRVEAGQNWIVDTPATTELRVTGYKCNCGATREKTQYSGMYTLHDQASWDRINACYQFFKQGLAGADTRISGAGTFLPYGNWESVIVSSGSTDGAWMWIFIRDWKLDNYDYLKDSVKDGTNTQEEADMVKALYEEIPRIFRGAIERVAPQGGTELYNYTVNLINQAGGNPDKVPSLSGAQGLIPENIPGLYVTIDELRGGFALTFWAE